MEGGEDAGLGIGLLVAGVAAVVDECDSLAAWSHFKTVRIGRKQGCQLKGFSHCRAPTSTNRLKPAVHGVSESATPIFVILQFADTPAFGRDGFEFVDEEFDEALAGRFGFVGIHVDG